MDRDGHYTWDGFYEERQRFDEVKRIIDVLR